MAFRAAKLVELLSTLELAAMDLTYILTYSIRSGRIYTCIIRSGPGPGFKKIGQSGSNSVESKPDQPSPIQYRATSQANALDSLDSGLTRPDSGVSVKLDVDSV